MSNDDTSSDSGSSCEEYESIWQASSGLTSAVLYAVFAWLSGPELARAGAVCRAWRSATASPALWRHLLMPSVAVDAATLAGIPWREEYVRVHARWEAAAQLAAPATGALLHAALDHDATRLAITTDDALILIWELDADEKWREVWRHSLQTRGWERVARAQWARGADWDGRGPRLLLAGPIALAQRWELLVLQPDESDGWMVASRCACGAGAAGCWAGRAGSAYLALEPRRLATALRITTVYINAATQETQSEYAGVTAPLLNIFNEDNSSITHVAVADVPLQDVTTSEQSSDEEDDGNTSADGYAQVLVAGFGGPAGAVRAWYVHALQPPPLLASGDLRARAAAHAAAAAERRADHEPEPEPEMTEAEVRAMCTPPDAESHLTGSLIGLTVQNDSRCVWACVSGGALSAWSLPWLRPLRQLPAPALPPRVDILHYVHLAVGRHYIATPEGGLSGRVWMWGARSGAQRPAPLDHPAPALAVAYPRTSRTSMVVLTTDYLYVWRSTATPQMSEFEVLDMYHHVERPVVSVASLIAPSLITHRHHHSRDMALRNAIGSCARIQSWRAPVASRSLASRSCEGGGSAEPCPPCVPTPPPPCRGVPPERMHAKRVVCCPPPQGNPPPCAAPCIKPPLTCAEADTKNETTGRVATCIRKEVCGLELDRVAKRLEQVKQHRRRSYEQEAAQRRACREPFPEPVPYSLGAERECCKATDGRDYHMVKCGPVEMPPCGPGRVPPPPRCVELTRDTACQVHGPEHVDPCAHQPRTIVTIDRSKQPEFVDKQQFVSTKPTKEEAPKSSTGRAGSAPPSPARKFTKRLMESLSLNRKTEAPKSCPRRSCDTKCDGQGAKRAGDQSWCSNLKPPPEVPPPCRKLSHTELLRQRPLSRCGPNDRRSFHTAVYLFTKSEQNKTQSVEQMKADAEKLKKALKDRESYKDAAQGRVAPCLDLSNKSQQQPTASLDVCLPPGAEKLSLRVLIDDGVGCSKKSKYKQSSTHKEKEPVTCPDKSATAATPAAMTASSTTRSSSPNGPANQNEKRETWRSIKSLLASCRKDNAHTPTCPTNAPQKPPTPQPPNKPPPAEPICKPPTRPTNAPQKPSTQQPPDKPSPVEPICKPLTRPNNAPQRPPTPQPPNKPPPIEPICKPTPALTPHKTPADPSPCKTPPSSSPSKPPSTPCPHKTPNTPSTPTTNPHCKPHKPVKEEPTKPKDPCKSSNTKFTAVLAELETFILKW